MWIKRGGERCSYVVERPLMERLVVGSIRHGGPIELFLVPVYGIVHLKEPLLLIEKV